MQCMRRTQKSCRITRNDDMVSSSFYGMSNLEEAEMQGEYMSETSVSENEYPPSVSLALPPVGWHRMLVHEAQTTTVWACEKTVVMEKQPMKQEKGGISLR